MTGLALRMGGDRLTGDGICIVLVELTPTGSSILFERQDPARWDLWQPGTGPCLPWPARAQDGE